MKEPVWIREDVVLAIHKRQLAEYGGGEGVRNEGLLASALAQPKNFLAYAGGEPDLPRVAASYAWGLIRNRPFVAGNNRMAYLLCRTFLKLNGLDFAANSEAKCLAFLQFAERLLSEDELAAWIKKRLTRD